MLLIRLFLTSSLQLVHEIRIQEVRQSHDANGLNEEVTEVAEVPRHFEYPHGRVSLHPLKLKHGEYVKNVGQCVVKLV